MCDHRKDDETKRIAYAVLAFLDEEFRKPTTTIDSRESLEVAMQCLETAFGITIRDSCLKPAKSLREVYHTGPNAVPMEVGSGQWSHPGAGHNSNPQPGTIPNSNPQPQNRLFMPPTVVDYMNSMTGAAGGAPPIQPVEIKLGPKYVPPLKVEADVKVRADTCKDTGNGLMKEGGYHEALKIYTEAIDMDGNNAVYFCNRSASYIKLGDLDKALRDVQIAIQLDPTYARAYGRMGVIHSNLGNHIEAYSCYKKANELDPTNESYSNNLQVSTALVSGNEEPTPDYGANQLPNTQQFASLFENPALMSMATQMLQDPGMQNLMRSLMSNLSPFAAAASGVTGNNGGGVGGGPGASEAYNQILQMGQAIATQITNASQSPATTRRPGDTTEQDPPQNDSYDL